VTEPAEPKPAASVVLVRAAAPAAPEPLEVYMIRRHQTMRFLGGYYAFPGGKVDADDASPAALARCRGLRGDDADALMDDRNGVPALAFWMTAVRELLEETGLLLACDPAGTPIDVAKGGLADIVDACQKSLIGGGQSFADLLEARGWYADLRALRYLSHFITPRTSPIRFTARFFLCPVPAGQAPRLFHEETSEGFWLHPGDAYRRFLANEMPMAEPAEYGVAYLAQFGSLDELWAAHADGRHKLEGLIHRIEFWKDFDWKKNRWKSTTKTSPP
jgi:8-oxo-dGTP pyrophosphatase MutT (NUDIX family)